MNQRLALCLVIVLCLAASSAAAPGAATLARPTERVSPAPEVNPNAVVWRTPEPPKDPQAGDVWVNAKDGMEMVYVAPGEFILGTSEAQIDAWLKEHPNDKREWFADEQPQRRVNLPGYWIGRTEVTNAQYLRFVLATSHRPPEHWKDGRVPSGLDGFPVVFVDSEDARAYCEWARGHLPSQLEWEKAARGTDGRIFPWGDHWDGKRCRCLESITGIGYASALDGATALFTWMQSHDTVHDGPAVAGSYRGDRSPFGCMDMAGNVWEWCADWYDPTAYQRYAAGDLTSPATGESKVARGGSWEGDAPSAFRCARVAHNSPNERRGVGGGFRCARDRIESVSAERPAIEAATERVAAQARSVLPPFAQTVDGTDEVRVRNPNDFSVEVGLRSGNKGKDWDVPANGVASAFVPDGKYDIYFVYSSKPDALFQGDSFTLNGNGVEIQIVKVVGGNYNIRQVK
jgi:formylglycine-generating enzyme required for sulfatase activity